jgi:hypothetical protein
MNRPSLIRTLIASVCVFGVAGCQAEDPNAAASAGTPASAAKPLATNAPATSKPPVFANQLAKPAPGSAAAASSAARVRVVQLDVYQLLVPLGAISRSEEFWKHVDEQTVDVGTYDLLRKNGWRIGVAPMSDYGYFKDIIDAYPASATPRGITAAPGGGGGAMELPMKTGIAYQNIFYFTDENRLFGRTFEDCDNIATITLQQAPRKPGEARVTVCPMVRGIRKRFEVTNRDNEKEREIRYKHPEHLYELNCQVDIPVGQLLIVAPSPEVKWKTSLGATFLVRDEAAERTEQVLLLVPRSAELEETAR